MVEEVLDLSCECLGDLLDEELVEDEEEPVQPSRRPRFSGTGGFRELQMH